MLNICQDVCRNIYDLYDEEEEEEEEAPHLLPSPARHLNLNINVGGTVSSPTLAPAEEQLENLQ